MKIGRVFLSSAILVEFVSAQLSTDHLVFSEILPNPVGGDRGAFIELYNPTGREVDASLYQVCNGAGTCTSLAGRFSPASYYVLCNDMSFDMTCRQATKIQLDVNSDLYIYNIADNSLKDSANWGINPPLGSSYLRGLFEDPWAWGFSATNTPGVGLLGGPFPTRNPSTPLPTPNPTPIPTLPPTPVPTPLPTPVPTVRASCSGSNTCVAIATCVDITNGFTCLCPSGYTGNGRSDGNGCTDINGTILCLPT
jgi:hypothetical protein